MILQVITLLVQGNYHKFIKLEKGNEIFRSSGIRTINGLLRFRVFRILYRFASSSNMFFYVFGLNRFGSQKRLNQDLSTL